MKSEEREERMGGRKEWIGDMRGRDWKERERIGREV
jgi:hypothetical protein